MTSSGVRAAILRELESSGHLLAETEHDLDLVSAGVNSASLIRILSALEELFDIDLDVERLFAGPVTVTRLEAEIIRAAVPS